MTFQLPDFLKHSSLNSLRLNMGAALSSTVIAKIPIKIIELPEITRLREDGIDIEKWEDLQVLEDGTLAYKSKRVLLYIRDFTDVHGLPKFHTALCSKLTEMKTDGRWGRYVIANREDGNFAVSIKRGEQYEDKKLDVCRLCLNHLQWQGYRSQLPTQERDRLVREFSLPNFFKVYPRDLIIDRPKYTSDTAPINDYTLDWARISQSTKNAKNYSCELCSIQLKKGQSKYLHVHHKNGQKNENNSENLEVLCIRCHAEKPLHGYMKMSPDYLEYLAM